MAAGKLKPIKISVKKSRKNPYTFSDKMDNDELHKLHLHAKAMEFAEKEDLDGYKHADYKKAEREIFDLMMSRGANPYRVKKTWADDWKEEYEKYVPTFEQFIKEPVLNEKKADGTISDDEDERRAELLKRVKEQMQELLASAEFDANDIGGSFRAPGIMYDIRKELDSQIKKFK